MKRKSKKMSVKKYPFVLSFDEEDEVYIARAIDLNGCHSDGRTPEEAIFNLYEAMEGWLKTAKKHRIPIPSPSIPKTKAKKFLLRLDPANTFKLETLAVAKNESINTLVNEAIANF